MNFQCRSVNSCKQALYSKRVSWQTKGSVTRNKSKENIAGKRHLKRTAHKSYWLSRIFSVQHVGLSDDSSPLQADFTKFNETFSRVSNMFDNNRKIVLSTCKSECIQNSQSILSPHIFSA